MGTSAPLVKKGAGEDVTLQNLVAETPMLPLKKGKLAGAGARAEMYRLQRQQKAEAKAAASKQQQRTVLLTKEADDHHDYMTNLDISVLSKYTRVQA